MMQVFLLVSLFGNVYFSRILCISSKFSKFWQKLLMIFSMIKNFNQICNPIIVTIGLISSFLNCLAQRCVWFSRDQVRSGWYCHRRGVFISVCLQRNQHLEFVLVSLVCYFTRMLFVFVSFLPTFFEMTLLFFYLELITLLIIFYFTSFFLS